MASMYEYASGSEGTSRAARSDVQGYESEKQATSMLSQMEQEESAQKIGAIGQAVSSLSGLHEGYKSRKELGRAAHALGAVKQKRSLGDYVFGGEREYKIEGEEGKSQIMSASALRAQYKTALADPSSDEFKALKSTGDYEAPSMLSEVKKGYETVSSKIGEGVSAVGEGVGKIGGALATAAGKGIERRRSEMTDERERRSSGRKSILKGLKGLTKSSDTGSGGEVYSPSPGIKKVRGGKLKFSDITSPRKGKGGTVKGTAKKLKPGQEPFMPEGKTKESTVGHMWKGKFVKGTREDFLARRKTKPAPKPSYQYTKGGHGSFPSMQKHWQESKRDKKAPGYREKGEEGKKMYGAINEELARWAEMEKEGTLADYWTSQKGLLKTGKDKPYKDPSTGKTTIPGAVTSGVTRYE